MTEYRIQELFDFQECKKYYVIQTNYLGRGWIIQDIPRLDTLRDAKTIVRIMKEYETPKYHYHEEEN
jgi:hypothetical protein